VVAFDLKNDIDDFFTTTLANIYSSSPVKTMLLIDWVKMDYDGVSRAQQPKQLQHSIAR